MILREIFICLVVDRRSRTRHTRTLTLTTSYIYFTGLFFHFVGRSQIRGIFFFILLLGFRGHRWNDDLRIMSIIFEAFAIIIIAHAGISIGLNYMSILGNVGGI